MPPPQENAYNLGVCHSKVTKLDAYKCSEFRKNIANKSPQRYKFLAKIRIFFTVLGAVFPHFCPEFHLLAKFHLLYHLRGEKPIVGPLAVVGDNGLKVQYKLAHVRYTPARA